LAKKIQWLVFVTLAFLLILVTGGYVLLASYDYNSLKPRIEAEVMNATGRALTIGGDIRFEMGLTPALVLKEVSFQNAPWGTRPEMAMIERLEVDVALIPLFSRRFVVKRFILIGPDLLVERREQGETNFDFGPPRKDPLKTEGGPSESLTPLSAFAFHNVSVENGVLLYREGRSGRTSKLTIAHLEAVSTGFGAPIDLSCKGALERFPFEALGTLGPLTDMIRKEKPWDVALKVNLPGITAAVEGSVRDPLGLRGIDLEVTARAGDLKEFFAAAGTRSNFPEPIEFEGRFSDPAERVFRVSGMGVRAGENRLSGTVELQTDTTPVTVSALLETDRLDLRPFAGKKESEQGRGARKKRVFPEDPISIGALEHVNGSVRIHAGKLLVPGLSLHHLSAEMTLRKGELNIAPLSAVLGTGKVEGRMKIGPRSGSVIVHVALKADGVDLGSVLREMEVKDVSGGRLHGELELSSRGNSVAGWMKNLDGHVMVISDGGRVHNRYIRLLGGNLSEGFFRMLNAGKDFSHTEIHCLVSRFDVEGGEARGTALVMDTPEMTVVGEGTIDLASEGLNISLKPYPKQGVAGVGVSLGELTKPFKLAGTLSEPSLAVDPAQSALVIGKAVGGVVLFGPVGIVAALVGGTKGEGNPCLRAVEAAKKGIRVGDEGGEKKGLFERTGEGIKQGVKDVGDKVKGWFRR
jgi:AsmA family protein